MMTVIIHAASIALIYLLLFALFRGLNTKDVYSDKSSTFVSLRMALMITVVIFGGWVVFELVKLLWLWTS